MVDTNFYHAYCTDEETEALRNDHASNGRARIPSQKCTSQDSQPDPTVSFCSTQGFHEGPWREVSFISLQASPHFSLGSGSSGVLLLHRFCFSSHTHPYIASLRDKLLLLILCLAQFPGDSAWIIISRTFQIGSCLLLCNRLIFP